jgi:hypothetical protein
MSFNDLKATFADGTVSGAVTAAYPAYIRG